LSRGHVLLSHGLESGPHATKVTAMAATAEALGWRTTRPDFRDLDATRDVKRIADRIARVVEAVAADEPLVLAGSSMGAFASGLASLQVPCDGLFLLAPPLAIPGFAHAFDMANVPAAIVHGWDDELIPASDVIAFAHARRIPLTLVDDSHRLANHVELIAQWFGLFLQGLDDAHRGR
jgi:predicted alpha/beta-hydrolase family hydrolase